VKKLLLPILALTAWIALASPALAATHFWPLVSPNHEQTYAYGTETNRVWKQWGRHLALLLTFTNDPYVDFEHPRQWDNFRFDFPNVRLGADGRTFYYHTSDGRKIPVAARQPDLLGIDEVKLLPNASVVVSRPSGYITVYLNVLDPDGLAVQ
jgi:hypothetical protein